MTTSCSKNDIALMSLSSRVDGRRFAVGKNAETLRLHAIAPLVGIVDDSCAVGADWCGIPLVKASALPPQALVINCASSIAPVSAEKRIRSANRSAEVISFYELCEAAPEKLRPPAFVDDMKLALASHGKQWTALRDCLSDQESVKVLEDVIRLRVTGCYQHMSRYSVRMSEQYFDPVCCFSEGEVFVDCGGYDGDTTCQFVRRCPSYKRVWLFEPSEVNMRMAKDRLAGVRDIRFVTKGVSDEVGVLNFDANAGSASAISDVGMSSIVVATLDHEVSERISFAKMDLEGWELRALAGARGHIEADHPKLAVAVYHHASHFWEIPMLILEIRDDYDIFLRHYTEGWSETVMYFVPR